MRPAMGETAHVEIKVGQIWREVDPRRERFVRVESVSMGRCGVSIRTVEKRDRRWLDAPRSRLSYADHDRFNAKRGGYALHEQPTA